MRALAWVVALVAAGGMAGGAAYLDRPETPVWREIAWPFPRDAWPAGRAFRCSGASCGRALEVYVRPKIGFCNCATGVADDDEVDRVADLDMITDAFEPVAPGTKVDVGGMAGRSRAYTLLLAGGGRRPAVGIALSKRCDLVAAVAQGEAAASPAARQEAAALLASRPVADWLRERLGG